MERAELSRRTFLRFTAGGLGYNVLKNFELRTPEEPNRLIDVRVTAETLNVRCGPGTDYQKLRQIDYNNIVTVDAFSPDILHQDKYWLRISDAHFSEQKEWIASWHTNLNREKPNHIPELVPALQDLPLVEDIELIAILWPKHETGQFVKTDDRNFQILNRQVFELSHSWQTTQTRWNTLWSYLNLKEGEPQYLTNNLFTCIYKEEGNWILNQLKEEKQHIDENQVEGIVSSLRDLELSRTWPYLGEVWGHFAPSVYECGLSKPFVFFVAIRNDEHIMIQFGGHPVVDGEYSIDDLWSMTRDEYEKRTPHASITDEMWEDYQSGAAWHREIALNQPIDPESERACMVFSTFLPRHKPDDEQLGILADDAGYPHPRGGAHWLAVSSIRKLENTCLPLLNPNKAV